MFNKGFVRWLAGSVMLALVTGCGETSPDVPELAEVTGRVTLAGQPIQDAIVVFQPEKGALSTGATDADGRFELFYSQDHKGAVLGKHTVTISKMEGEAGDETIPRQYNEGSQLTAQVTEGPNEFTFDLK